MSRTALRRALVGAASLAALAVFVGRSVEGRAKGDEPVVEPAAPRGMVAFFAGGACPPGWVPADEVEGRLVVGTTEPGAVGLAVGAPLGDREDRGHLHALTAAATLSSKEIVAVDGSNDDGAAARTYSVTGATSSQGSGLPFVQVRACARP